MTRTVTTAARALVATLVVAVASPALADFCVGRDCGQSRGYPWHLHGCYQPNPSAEVARYLRAGEDACLRDIQECWDKNDGTCDSLGQSVPRSRCANAPANSGLDCAAILKRALDELKAAKEREKKEAEERAAAERAKKLLANFDQGTLPGQGKPSSVTQVFFHTESEYQRKCQAGDATACQSLTNLRESHRLKNACLSGDAQACGEYSRKFAAPPSAGGAQHVFFQSRSEYEQRCRGGDGSACGAVKLLDERDALRARCFAGDLAICDDVKKRFGPSALSP